MEKDICRVARVPETLVFRFFSVSLIAVIVLANGTETQHFGAKYNARTFVYTVLTSA